MTPLSVSLQSSPKMQGDADDDGQYFFFSAPASPVHYILRSPPSSTAAASSPYFADADCCGAAAAAAGDFEFAAHGAGTHGGPGTKGGVVAMSSAEELFVAGRIRVGCLAPIRQEDDGWEECGGGVEDEEPEGDGRSPRAATRRARSASPTRSPRADRGAAFAEPASGPFASASSSSSSSSSSSASAKNIRRRLSLRDLLSRTGADWAGADQQASSGTEVTSRLGFWPPSIWPSRSSKKSPCPAPQPGRRSTSSDRDRGAAVPMAAKRAPGGGSARRTTSLPYRQGLVLGCLGFGARGYGLAKSMHPLPSR